MANLEAMKALFGNTLDKSDGPKVDVDSLTSVEIFGIYFTAHWDPYSRQFTPVLKEFSEVMNESVHKFEAVCVSSDRSRNDLINYLKEAGEPWITLFIEYGSPVVTKLKEKFGVRGIPTLIILDNEGNVLSTKGREDVSGKEPDAAWRDWKRKSDQLKK